MNLRALLKAAQDKDTRAVVRALAAGLHSVLCEHEPDRLRRTPDLPDTHPPIKVKPAPPWTLTDGRG